MWADDSSSSKQLFEANQYSKEKTTKYLGILGMIYGAGGGS